MVVTEQNFGSMNIHPPKRLFYIFKVGTCIVECPSRRLYIWFFALTSENFLLHTSRQECSQKLFPRLLSSSLHVLSMKEAGLEGVRGAFSFSLTLRPFTASSHQPLLPSPPSSFFLSSPFLDIPQNTLRPISDDCLPPHSHSPSLVTSIRLMAS